MRKIVRMASGLALTWVVATGLAAGAPSPDSATPGEAMPPGFVLKPDKGFIDDPYALDPQGTDLAVLRTDSASFARLEIIDLPGRKNKPVIELGDPHPGFERVVFAGNGRGVIVIVRDPADGRRSAQFFGPDGKPAGLAGPVTDFGVTWRGGKPALIGWDKTKLANGDTTFTISQFDPAGLARLGKSRAYVAGKTGELKKPPFKIIAWQNGYSQMVGQRPGSYDAKKDFRQPDQAAILDVLQGDFTWSSNIGDVYGWALVSDLRRKRENRSLFAVLAEDGSSFDFVDGQGRRTPLKLPVALQMYDPRSLQEQEDGAAGLLYFSLAIDPLNPDALGRKKADKPFLDVYAVRPPALAPSGTAANGNLAVTRLVRTALDDRPVSWAGSGQFLVLLRKFKSFSRGGNEMEVYALK